MIKKLIVSASVIAAAFAVAGLAEKGMYLASAGCIGWMVFVVAVNIVKPRAATRGKVQNKRSSTKILYLYDIIAERRFQDEVRKMWEEQA